MDTSYEPQQRTTEKNTQERKWLMWLTILLIVVLLAGLGYMCWLLQECNKREDDLKKSNQALQAELAELRAKDNDKEGTDKESACNNVPSASMKENIKAALDTENTEPFSTYTTNPVSFVIAGTEQGGTKTPDEAALAMDYTHSATGPWDFTLPQATLDNYDAGFYTDYFDDNTYVGRAASGMIAAFNFDCNGKIKQIFLAADEDML